MPPDFTVAINGTLRPYVAGTLEIDDDLEGRGRITFDVESADASYKPAVRDEVIVSEDGVQKSGGTVEAPSTAGVGGVGLTPIVTRVTAIDLSAILERRHVTGTIPAGNLKAGLQWLMPFYASHGLTLNAAQVNGPNLPELPYPELTLGSDVVGDFETLTGYVVEVSPTKVLRMFAPGTEVAAFNIVENDGNVFGDIEVEKVDQDYANRIVLRYTAAAIAAYAYLSVTANFADGKTVVVGSRTYTFQTVLTDVNGNVLIGATIDASLTNLVNAINHVDAHAGSTHAGTTAENTQVSAYLRLSGQVMVSAVAAGTAGNSIGVSTTAASATWIGEGAVPTSTLTRGQDESLSNQVQADDVAQQVAPTGIWDVVVARPDVRSSDVAQAFANAYLPRAVQSTYNRVRYRTRRSGLKKGQTQTITAAARGAAGTHLLLSVKMRYERPFRPIWEVTAIAGTTWPRTSWKDTFAQWNTGGSSVAALGGGLTVVSGSAISTHVALGGARTASVPMGSPPAWTPVLNWIPFYAPASFQARIRVELWARSAGVAVKARFYNLTDATSVESGTVTSQVPVETTFTVTITPGKSYRLEVQSTTNGESAYAIGQLERL